MSENFPNSANTSGSGAPTLPNPLEVTPQDIENASGDDIARAINLNIASIQERIGGSTSDREKELWQKDIDGAESAQNMLSSWRSKNRTLSVADQATVTFNTYLDSTYAEYGDDESYAAYNYVLNSHGYETSLREVISDRKQKTQEAVQAAPSELVTPEGFVLGMPGENGFYVPTDLHDQIAIQNASIRARGRIRQPDAHTQLNHFDDGRALTGPLPNQSLQAILESSHDAQHEFPVDEFHELVDGENLNNLYAPELRSIYDYFQRKHLPIDPLIVISEDMAKKTYELTGRNPEDAEANLGVHIKDRSLLIEHEGHIRDYGRDYMLGVGIHEAAHSVFSGERTLRTYKETADQGIKLGWTATSGLVKTDLRRSAESMVSVTGQFLSEAFADSTRVRALREMDRSNDLNINANVSVGSVSITTKPNAADRSKITNDSGAIIMPAEYLMAVASSADGSKLIATPASIYAAYALDLMDSRSPGLYEDIAASAQDPKRQGDVIRKIEAIKPGLYRQLSELGYNTDDFAIGLRVVVDAIEAKPETEK